MRIITGRYRGRRITTVGGLSVRPATDRVRQALFNMLSTRITFEGMRVLDLFAGSGSLGLEALSRGAASVVFVEMGREAALTIEDTLEAFGCASSAEVIQGDALAYLAGESSAYDLIFADPPYAFESTADLPRTIISRGLLKPGGYLLIEHARPLSFSSTGLYTVGPARRFGRTIVTFFQGTQP